MTLHPVPLGGPSLTGIKLKAYAVAVPALSSHIRPALVLAERESRTHAGRRARPGREPRRPVQSPSPRASRSGTVRGRTRTIPAPRSTWVRSTGRYDTPVRHYVTIYRAMVTQAGLEAGESTLTVLQSVMALTGIDVDDNRITIPSAPARDPFRRTA